MRQKKGGIKMPSMHCHLFFGKVVLDGMAVVRSLKITDKRAFLAGNILPDMSVLKHDAHYYYKPENEGFYRPNMGLVEKSLSTIANESLRLGVEGHLYLDYRFTTEFLAERFDYDPQTDLVRSKRGNKVWAMDNFLSKKGLYHGYGECNPLLFRDGKLSMEWVEENVPGELPRTGIIALDTRGLASWLDEFKWYLKDPPAYTGSILQYGELVDFVQQCAVDFSCRDHHF